MVKIGNVEGINERHATRLRSLGINSSDELLAYGATRRGRRRLATATRLSEQRVHEWIRRADLLRVAGVSGRYVGLLEVAGVETVRDLRRRSASKLRERLVEMNTDRPIVGRLPGEGEIDKWIIAAKELPIVIKRW